jgi:hypothetical protein
METRTETLTIFEINQIRKRPFHRLPKDARRAVVNELTQTETVTEKEIDRAIRKARRNK